MKNLFPHKNSAGRARTIGDNLLVKSPRQQARTNMTSNQQWTLKLGGLKLALITLLFITHAAQADSWYANTSASLTQGSYSGSVLRKQLSETGLIVGADYLEQGGVALGLSKTQISMKGSTSTNQNNLLLSGKLHYWLDAIPGKVTLRVDAHRITNNDTSGDTNNVSALAPQVSWLSNDAMLYADLGFAASRYQNQLTANQFTPTIGFALNNGSDWVQLRAYLISGLNPARAANRTSTQALDAKLTHFFASQSALVPSSVTLSVAGGDRLYAVDMDAQSVANLSDIHKSAASLAFAWNVTKASHLLVVLGQSRFQNVTLNNNYKLNVGYASFSTNW